MAVFMLAGAPRSALPEESPSSVLRSTVAEVQLLFTVSDSYARPLHDISSTDFAVVDDEVVVRQFRSFQQLQTLPLDITVLVDRSASVSDRNNQLGRIVDLITQLPLRTGDGTTVLAFASGRPELVCSKVCAPESLLQDIARIPNESQTTLFDAIVYAAKNIPSATSGTRQVILVFSDGDDNLSRNSVSDAISAALAASAEVYTVDLSRPNAESRGSALLQAIADATGGKRLALAAGAAEEMNNLIDGLRSAFMVTYLPAMRRRGMHSVRILPTRNMGLRFHSRHGYLYEEAGRQN